MAIICVGADIGQKQDPTALVVCEYEKILIGQSGEPMPDDTGLDWFNIGLGLAPEPVYDTRYVVRSTRRLPLGLPYPAVATHIDAVCDYLLKRHAGCELYLCLDATGVGAPVVDLIHAGIREDVHVTAVTITAGDKCPSSPLQRSAISMAKTWMVSRLQALLQSRRLVMPQGSPEAMALAEELLSFELRVHRDGQTESGAFKTGAHDDLVTALGLSVLGECHMAVTYTPFTP